jgi:uncharacterized protein
MNPKETQALQAFLAQLLQVRGTAKDPQADALITSALAQQPDAGYLLVQRAMLLDQALEAAKGRIADLQNQIRYAKSAGSGSFLNAAGDWGNGAAIPSRPVETPAAPVPQPAPQSPSMPMQSPPPPSPGFLHGRAASMLGSVAATAAGVAGGAFLFQGLENLLGHHNGGSGFLAGPGIAPLAAPAENTTVNNFFGSDTGSGTGYQANEISSDDGIFDDFSDDDGSSFA